MSTSIEYGDDCQLCDLLQVVNDALSDENSKLRNTEIRFIHRLGTFRAAMSHIATQSVDAKVRKQIELLLMQDSEHSHGI